jgi:hypothetical protein
MVQYVNFVFENIPGKLQVYQAMCTNALMYIMMRKQLGVPAIEEDEDFFSFSWFIFDIIIKSMTLDLYQRGSLGDNTNRGGRFEESYTRILKKFLRFFTQYIKNCPTPKSRNDANNYQALFVRDLFSIYDRGHVIDMVKAYVEDITPTTWTDKEDISLSYFKHDFLKIVIDYEHYIPLNLPLPIKITNIQNLSAQLW